MNISTFLLSKRASRSGLFLVAGLVALGILLVGDATALRVLGAIGAVLIAMLLKVAAEQFAQLRHLEHSLREARQMTETSTLTLRETRSQLREAQHRLARVEAAMFDDGGSFARAQRDARSLIEELRLSTSKAMDEMSTRMDSLIVAVNPTRRHRINEDVAIRELGLSGSLAGLKPEREPERSD